MKFINIKKLCVLLGFLSSGLFGSCAKECCDPCGNDSCDCDPCLNCTVTCSSCCCEPCCCEPCDFTPPCPPDTCGYNAPVIRDIKCGWDVFATGSYVYLQAKEENLHFYVLLLDQFLPLAQISTETIYPMTFDYNSGFKVGVGMHFSCDGWAFFAEYLRYHATAGKGFLARSIEQNADNLCMESLQVSANNQGQALNSCTSNSNWILNLDIVDASIYRSFYVGKCLAVTVYGGLRLAWVDQKASGLFESELNTGEAEITFNNSFCSWGVGPRYAVDAQWLFCAGLYLYNNLSFSILYTEYDDIDHKETEEGDYITLGLFTREKKYDLCFLRSQADLEIGVGWGDYFFCNDWYFDVKIGYEARVLWNQNMMPLYVDNSPLPSDNNGDLFLHGLVVTARLDF